MTVHTILYVSDQKQSRDFYAALLGQTPELDVPGMTEFVLSESHRLGLMPEQGIKRLLGDNLPDPTSGGRPPRAEIYFRVENPRGWMERALEAGARLLSPCLPRDWGDEAGYVLDADGHVLAFAARLNPE